MADFALGLDAVAYRNSGTYGSPTWTSINSVVKDVTVSMDSAEWDGTTRGIGWRQLARTLKQASIDFKLVFRSGNNAHYEALRDAFINGTVIDMAFSSETITNSGAEYFRSEMNVMKFVRNEPLEEGITFDITVKPAPSTNAPTYTEVA